MRNMYSFLAAALFVCMLLVPCLAAEKDAPDSGDSNSFSTADGDTFRVKCGEDIITVSESEYVCGVVAAEMPALYEEEALKAQSVAAYTYAVRKRNAAKDAQYDITGDSSTDQAYIDKSARKEKWGSNFEKYEKRIASAVEAVSGEIVSYDGEPILAAYHAISAGKTEAAVNVWGSDYTYLQSVESIGDMLSDRYQTVLTFTQDKLKELLSSAVVLEGDSSGWLGEMKCSNIGTVQTVTLCGKEISGSDIRTLLSLPSSNFDVELKDGSFCFTVRGYGHGVGMSQYGANCMAQQGSDYKEILLWYYPGCEIK